MSYDVGTRVDLTHLNRPSQKKELSHEPTRRLFDVGTKVLFIKALEKTQALVITPNASAYVQPFGAL